MKYIHCTYDKASKCITSFVSYRLLNQGDYQRHLLHKDLAMDIKVRLAKHEDYQGVLALSEGNK